MGKHFKTTPEKSAPKSTADEKREKRKGRWSIKSCFAIFLAAAVTTATIHSQVLYAQAETGKTPDTRISFTFQPLEESVRQLTLPTKGSLEDTLLHLPAALSVMTQTGSVIPDPDDPAAQNPPENDTSVGDISGNAPDSGAADSDLSENADGSDAQSPEDATNSGAAGSDLSENADGSDVQPPENATDSGAAASDFSENADDSSSQSPESTTDSGAAGSDSSETVTSSLTVTVPDTLVSSAPGETSIGIMMLENNANPDVTGNNPADNTDSNVPADHPADNTDSSEPADHPASPASSELSVSWSCDHYEEIRDFYVFTPVWDEGAYRYDGSPEEIPVITVIFSEIPGIHRVSSQEELQNVFLNLPADGAEHGIVLMNDIALTDTLHVPDLPAGTKVTLESNIGEDGTTHSLTRGITASGAPFTGAMLLFGTPEVSVTAGDAVMPFSDGQNTDVSLTLRNITIDGKKTAGISDTSSPDNQVNAPAVISSGNLILEKNASILNNYNIGTYLFDENGQPALDENGVNLYAVPPCGGGLWIRGGTLELRKGSLIRGNCAALSGGGIYLDTGAVLRYYAEAEALTGNTVPAGAAGADLYACAGSTIYYDPALFIKWSSFYIDPDALLIPDGSTLDMDTPIEIYLNVSQNSGYSFRRVKEKLESCFGDRVTVLLPQTYIDTTDLRNWFVYDHYDMNCWNTADTNGNNIPDSWEKAYREYLHRPYFVYNSDPMFTGSTSKGDDIPTWLEKTASTSGTLYLAPFKEHIYSRTENGRPEMTFAGYDRDANVDFLFYNPKSDGQKIVEFDINSSKVNTHTLDGSGFLVNTGIKNNGTDQLLSGYLIYYTYGPEMQDSTVTDSEGNQTTTQVPTGRTVATRVSLRKFNNININRLHNNGGIETLTANTGTYLVGSQDIANWDSQMSIEITVDSNQVTVKQWPKNNMDSSAAESFTWNLAGDTGYNGFGPLVAYKSHGCSIASSFTYSNLRMRFTNPDDEKNLLSPLMESDFSQQGNVKKYYLNLLGKSGNSYNTTDQMGQYREFLYLMQDEGIGLITDADTPFEEYLGKNGSQNLYEITSLEGTADLNALITSLQSYLPMHSSTALPGNPESIGLNTPETDTPIGNIWLVDINQNQISRTLDGNRLPENYYVEIMDISCNLPEGGADISYSLLKPGSSNYLPLPLGSGESSAGDADAFFGVRGVTGVSFVITHDKNEWPAGEYTVRQQVGNSHIYGYSYFTLTRPTFIEPEPEVPSDTPPVPPPTEPPAEETPAVTESSSGSSGGSAPALAAPEITVPDVVQPSVTSDGASQPKTGDGMFPAMPVACGACTAFMMKIMLWMYDIDFDMVTERKEEMVSSLILWGKGSTKPRIYMAIVALTVVITAYHLLRAFVANSKQIVRERLGI